MFQNRLYELRKGRGISQEELADIVGVSRQAVQKWESGASRPDMDNLAALAHYFGVSLDYLVTGVERPAAPAPQENFRLGWHYEYKSKASLFGLPLVHVNLGYYGICRAKGVLAIGNVATGIFALGGLSAGLVALGGTSVGVLALGGLAVGGLAVGGVAAGVLCAVGGLALSFGLALGGGAVSLSYAMGGGAFAGQVAAGGAASAPIAIGDSVRGAVTFQKDLWTSETPAAIRAAITAQFPHTPGWLVDLFAALSP